MIRSREQVSNSFVSLLVPFFATSGDCYSPVVLPPLSRGPWHLQYFLPLLTSTRQLCYQFSANLSRPLTPIRSRKHPANADVPVGLQCISQTHLLCPWSGDIRIPFSLNLYGSLAGLDVGATVTFHCLRRYFQMESSRKLAFEC